MPSCKGLGRGLCASPDEVFEMFIAEAAQAGKEGSTPPIFAMGGV